MSQFVFYVFKGDLLLELPSKDQGTLNNSRLQNQERLSEEIRDHLHYVALNGQNIQMGGESTYLTINKRPTHVYKIFIAPGKVQRALDIIRGYLGERNITVKVYNLGVVPALKSGETKLRFG